MSMTQIHQSFCYNGQPFQLAYQDTIAFLAGKFLYFWDLTTNKKDYIESEKAGFQSFVCHHTKGLVFVADYGIDPNVYIYTFPGKKQIAKTNIISQLEIIKMDLSLNGNKLLVVTGVPNYEITIFDVSDVISGQVQGGQGVRRLEGQYSSLPLKSKFLDAKFSPEKDTVFAVLYENTLQLCEINPSFEQDENDPQVINKNIRISKTSITTEGQFASFIWDEQNNIYLADKHNVKYLSGKNLTEVFKPYECDQKCKFFVLTQKHIIIIQDNGQFEWLFKYLPQNVEDEELKPFNSDYKYQYQDETLVQIMYNHKLHKLFAGTSEGSIIIFPEEAEKMGDEDEEANDQDVEGSDDDDKTKEIDIKTIQYGPYPVGSVIFLKEFQKLNILLTISSLGRIFLWNLQNPSNNPTQELLYTSQIKQNVSCVEMDSKDQLLFLGSDQGVLRILNFSNLKDIEVIKRVKLLKNKPIDFIQLNRENNILAIGSKQSKKIYFVSYSENEMEKPKPFKLIGYAKMPYRYNSLCWNMADLQKQEQKSSGRSNLFVLANYFLFSVESPNPEGDYKDLFLELPIHGRKIEPDLYLLQVNPKTGQIYASGEDRFIKIYEQPIEEFEQMDTKIRPGGVEGENIEGHDLPSNFMKIVQNNDNQWKVISGGQDGSIYIRDLDRNLTVEQKIKAHNMKFQGVSTLAYSCKYPIIYSGGYDGSIFLWALQSFTINELDNNEDAILDERSEITDQKDSTIPHYQKVLEEEYIRSQKEIREKSKKEILEGLEEIQNSLQQLLKNNQEAEELEQLSRDDFVIDISTRDQILEIGKEECKKLRISAQKQNYKQEILRQKLMEKTWDTMQEHLKAINGLDTNIIVYNYHIRKRSQQELQKLKWVQHFRKIEIKEKQKRKDESKPERERENEVVDIKEFISNPNEYFINGTPTKTPMVLVDYEKLEEAKQQEIMMSQKPTKPGQGGHGHGHGHQNKMAGQTQGKGGFSTKAKKEAEAKKLQEEKEAEERRKKKEEEEKKANEKEQSGGSNEMSEWNYLYGALELFTNNQKRNQIIMLHSIIFKIKEEYNKEFDSCQSLRSQMIDNIQDKNKKIEEILLELHKEPEFFEPKHNVHENPEKNILFVDGKTEIPFEKFLTREEKKRLEEEKRKEEERLAALMADDAGRRAIQQMMNGTLEEKKENPLDEQLEKEEWMDLPQDEMTDDQRIKFKEYEIQVQKQEEEKEKIRKNLESQLKKLRQEIVEICQKFDQKLLILFRRKLEYDYRISEQELYIVKLSLSIILEKDYTQKKIECETRKLELQEKKDFSAQLMSKLEIKQQEIKQKQQKYEQDYESVFKQKTQNLSQFDEGKFKQIWNPVFQEQKDEKDKKRQDEELMRDPQYSDFLIQLDPFREVRKKEVKSEIEANFESYQKDIREKIRKQFSDIEGQPDQINSLNSVLKKKFDLRKQKELLENELRDITASHNQQARENQEIEQQFQDFYFEEAYVTESLANTKSDIEVILRFKQGLVEINSGQISPSLSSAILIPKQQIEEKNAEIQTQGNEKIRLMEAIKESKKKMVESNYELKKSQKTIERVECQTREVQLLKVKKEMQLALTKKDMKLNEYELQGLQNQINILIDATNKRISTFQKKEEKINEQIEFIQRENEQLKIQGGNLDNTVKQRQKISEMMSKKNQATVVPSGDDKGDEEAYNKFKQIATNRKLYDLAKRQTESIELLREELNKLKARTFANFSSVTK